MSPGSRKIRPSGKGVSGLCGIAGDALEGECQ
jgi:hypothetical protein